MAIMAERGGEVHIRVGGNTQETAVVVDSLPDGGIMEKDKENSSNPVRPSLTSPVLFAHFWHARSRRNERLDMDTWALGMHT